MQVDVNYMVGVVVITTKDFNNIVSWFSTIRALFLIEAFFTITICFKIKLNSH